MSAAACTVNQCSRLHAFRLVSPTSCINYNDVRFPSTQGARCAPCGVVRHAGQCKTPCLAKLNPQSHRNTRGPQTSAPPATRPGVILELTPFCSTFSTMVQSISAANAEATTAAATTSPRNMLQIRRDPPRTPLHPVDPPALCHRSLFAYVHPYSSDKESPQSPRYTPKQRHTHPWLAPPSNNTHWRTAARLA